MDSEAYHNWWVRLSACLDKSAYAQEKEPTYPIYVVQEGTTLEYAQRFNVTVDEIAAANGISDPNQLQVGMELKIPGISGIEGKLITEKVPFGEDLKSLSRKYQFPIPTLAKLNR
jgi:LysM repeat protein